jgi:serine/threonine protein kinase/tetratricopeptide (TPR) repeat protein
MDLNVSAESTCRQRPNPGSSQPPGGPEILPRSADPPRLSSEEMQNLLPRIGTQFLGFHLVAELGRGASGRVYLARQGDLADRQVALKVTTDEFDETQALAQLQHTNVVPIHSAHRSGPLCAVCMPYFGSTTLGDIIRDLNARSGVPTTGRDLLSTLYNRRGRSHAPRRPREADGDTTRRSRHRSARASEPVPEQPPPPSSASKATSILKMLETIGFVDACLWIGSRLADGLAHAHDRGILHLDLKPANVLLTDEGQPMLLDFNMARDTKRRATSVVDAVGGTLPYMAPEHIEAFAGGPAEVDARADVFSLGVMLYEMLARRRPFPSAVDRPPEELIAARKAGPPPLRSLNRTVSPAVEAIIHKCLAPNPADRYRSAQELAEDLRLHLGHRPLKHAPERSVPERFRKWIVRHPRLASWTTAGVVMSAAAIVLAGWIVARDTRLGRLEALTTLMRFESDVRDVQFLLTPQTGDREQLDRGVAAGRELLARYGVTTDPHWQDRPAVLDLADAERDWLRLAIGDALLIIAQAEDIRGNPREALDLNQRAEALYPAGEAPRAVWVQRGRVLAGLGQTAEAARVRAAAEQVPLRTARDHYLVAAEHTAAGRYREALPHLDAACRMDPQYFWAAFLQGVANFELGRDAEALSSFRACLALRPDYPWAYLKRGLAYLRLKDYPNARADFDRMIELRPTEIEAYIQRAEARHQTGDNRGAADDLTRAMELGAPSDRVCALRAPILEALGDKVGADRDRKAGRPEPAAD